MTFKELIATLNEVSKLAITVAGGLGGLVAWWNNASLAVVVAYALGASLLVSLVVLAWRAFGVKATVISQQSQHEPGVTVSGDSQAFVGTYHYEGGGEALRVQQGSRAAVSSLNVKR
jgi:hypothetical protein